MSKKTEWEIERDKQVALRTKAMKSLTPEQLSTIKKVLFHVTILLKYLTILIIFFNHS